MSEIKEDWSMSEKEMELFDIICRDRNPTEALNIAIDVIIDYLAHSESCQAPNPVLSLESA